MLGLEEIVNKCEKVKEFCTSKVQDCYVGLVGNRLTMIGYSLVGLIFSQDYIISEINSLNLDRPYELFLRFTLAFLTGCAGGFLGGTGLGISTYRNYKKSQKHIKEFGRLRKKYARVLIEGSENCCFIGYCQQQGLYLAAKQAGQLDIFNEAKRKYSRVAIPFF